MIQEAGSLRRHSVLRRHKVHCSEAVGNVDVVPDFPYFDLIKARAVGVGRGLHASVKGNFHFWQVIPRRGVDWNNRMICSQPGSPCW